MGHANVERTPAGWLVSREFNSLAAAAKAVDLLVHVNERAFQPPPPPAGNLPRTDTGD
ncbi:hypothetical protein [Pseudoxanthomonas dokdonensis]|uniref:hypothetical protein n=1 Tax=Pseudoxanthomonas dokdonensis TaxID=344882 RepID=UPI000AE7A379|nr:hypothetical protein [Pseudoxanthomonas dokdonensis]